MKAHSLILAFLGLVALTVPSFAHHRVIIKDDYGGEIGHYSREFSALWRDGARVKIAGTCLSACTMFLGLPGTCVYPWAQIGFHQGRDAWGNPSPYGTYEMRRHYPAYLRGVPMPQAPGLNIFSGMDLIMRGAQPCM